MGEGNLSGVVAGIVVRAAVSAALYYLVVLTGISRPLQFLTAIISEKMSFAIPSIHSRVGEFVFTNHGLAIEFDVECTYLDLFVLCVPWFVWGKARNSLYRVSLLWFGIYMINLLRLGLMFIAIDIGLSFGLAHDYPDLFIYHSIWAVSIVNYFRQGYGRWKKEYS